METMTDSMASSNMVNGILAQAAKHFEDARPLIPMYIHLILSALFPIYTGAHASLSRPSSAAKPKKKEKEAQEDDDDEEDEKVQKMEGLSNKDAIILPVTAGIVLAGLYFLIKKYGADLINLILGWYFSGVGVYSVSQLINDALNFTISFLFPTYYASNRKLWSVSNAEKTAKREDGKAKIDSPLPPLLNALPLPKSVKSVLWSLRSQAKQKYRLKVFVDAVVDLRLNMTIVNVISTILGLTTIIYVNTVSKPWFLTNLQGFAVSYSALQLMSPTSFATGNLILGALFCYDIWAVFFTPLMVTVAKNLDQPIKLVFPRPDEPSSTPGEPPVRSYSMLGLGDIVLPGIMIGLALRFDLYLFYLKKQTKSEKVVISSEGEKTMEDVIDKAPYVSAAGRWGDRFWTYTLSKSALPARLRSSFPKPYFTASMVGYVFGMLATLGVMSVFQHAQPALLYLVPGVLISLWSTALVRGELREMWEFSEAFTDDQLEEGERSQKEADDEKTPKGIFERLLAEIWPFGDSEDSATKDKDEPKATTQTADSNTESDASKLTTKLQNDGVLFLVAVSRYNSSKDDDPKDDKDEHSASDGATENAATVSSTETNNSTEPRYRTRSARSPAA